MKEKFEAETQAWVECNPRLGWAFEQLEEEDEFRSQVLLGIVTGNMPASVLEQLNHFADALETRARAQSLGKVADPPEIGKRRPFEICVNRMERSPKSGAKSFRVWFVTDEGWSGMFDTKNPQLIGKIANERKLWVVGQVERTLYYDFIVVFDDTTRPC